MDGIVNISLKIRNASAGGLIINHKWKQKKKREREEGREIDTEERRERFKEKVCVTDPTLPT